MICWSLRTDTFHRWQLCAHNCLEREAVGASWPALWSLSNLLPLAPLLIVSAIGSFLCLLRISVQKLMQNILPIVGTEDGLKPQCRTGRSQMPIWRAILFIVRETAVVISLPGMCGGRITSFNSECFGMLQFALPYHWYFTCLDRIILDLSENCPWSEKTFGPLPLFGPPFVCRLLLPSHGQSPHHIPVRTMDIFSSLFPLSPTHECM